MTRAGNDEIHDNLRGENAIVEAQIHLEDGDVAMATYVMLGKYSLEGVKGISAKRSDEARACLAVRQCPQGRTRQAVHIRPLARRHAV
jgi:hypothetical protein